MKGPRPIRHGFACDECGRLFIAMTKLVAREKFDAHDCPAKPKEKVSKQGDLFGGAA